MAPLILLTAFLLTAPAPERRVAVVAQGAEAEKVVPLVEKLLATRGFELRRPTDLLVRKRMEARVSPPWLQAFAALREGRVAQEELELERAHERLLTARALLEKAGAEVLDPESLGEVLLALARLEFDRGDRAATAEALAHWGALDPAPLDARSMPPTFLAAAEEARRSGADVHRSVPLAPLFESEEVDLVLSIDSVGPRSAEAFVLLLYRRPSLQVQRLAAASRAGQPRERSEWLTRAVEALLDGPGAPAKAPSLFSLSNLPPLPPPDSGPPLRLHIGFALPTFWAYSRYGATTVAVGAEVGARVPLSFGEPGGSIEVRNGSLKAVQFTALHRFTLRKGAWRFSVEPGVALQAREGFTDEAEESRSEQRALATGTDQRTPTDLLLLLQVASAVGVDFTPWLGIEEQVVVGAVVAGNYDLNLPVALRTVLTFTL